MNTDNGALEFDVYLDNQRLYGTAAEAERRIKGLSNSVVKESERMDDSFSKIGSMVAGYFGIQALSNFSRQLVSVRGEFQQLEIAFEVMLGSKEKADAMMQQQIEFAAKTPFTLTEVASSTKQLMAMGVATEDVMKTMKALGDVAAGVSVPVSRIAMNYGQAIALGKLQGREIRDFAMAGISIVDELAKMLGKATDEIFEMSEAGSITSDMMSQAFQNMSSEGGKFYNLMERQNASVTGQLSNLQDKVSVMMNSIGESNEGIIYGAISGAATLVEHYQDILDVLVPVITTYGAYRAALILTAAVQKAAAAATFVQEYIAMGKAVGFATANQIAFNRAVLANPYAIAAAAVAGLIVVISRLVAAQNRVTETERAQQAVKEKASQQYDEQKAKIDTLVSVLNDEKVSLDKRRDALKELQGIVPNYHAALTAEGTLINNNKQAVDEYLKSLEKQIYMQATMDERIELTKRKRQAEGVVAKRQSAYDTAASRNVTGTVYGGEAGIAGAVSASTSSNMALNALNAAKKDVEELDKAIAKLDQEYSNLSQSLNAATSSESVAAVKNKEYWETVKKTAESARASLDVSQEGGELWKKYTAQIAEADRNLTKYKDKVKKVKEEKIEVVDIDETQFDVVEDEFIKMYGELLDNHKSYEQKKRDIDNYYFNAKIVAEEWGNKALLEQLAVDHKKALSDLQRDVLDGSGVGLVDLYIAGSGTDFIQAKIKEAMPLFDNLAGLTHSELEKLKGIIDDIGFTPEQVKLFEQAGINVEKLAEALKKAKEASKDAVSAQDWENVLSMAQKLSGSVAELGNALEGFGGTVADIGKGLVALAGQVDNVATAFSKTASMEDKISAGISGLASLISMVANQIAANKKAQEEWNQKIAQGKHEMAMLRIESEAYGKANIFGVENPYSRAIAGAKQYAQATKELYDAQKAVEGGQVQTGTKKVVSGSNVMGGVGAGAAVGAAVGSFIPVIGNLLGAGIGALVGGIVGLVSRKTVPVFENLKKKYGEVFDANGELNQAVLADYDKMDDATKKLIDNWEEIKAKQEEAQEQMRENFRDLAGDLGSSLSDALVEAFRNGDLYSAIDKFDAKMNDVISNIVSQLIFSAIFGQMFNDLEERFNESFGEGGDQNLVDDLTDFGSNYKDGLAAYNEAMKLANEEMKRSGLAGFTGSGGSKTGLSGAIQNVSEETASIISGQLNAIRIHQIESVDVMRNQLMELSKISSNTAYNSNLVRLNEILFVLKQIQSGDTLRSQGL